MTIEIVTLPPESRLIAPLVAPIAMSREAKAVMKVADTKTWWVAIAGGEPIGLVAADQHHDHVLLQHAIVLAAHRGKGVYRALFRARLKHVKQLGLRLRAVVAPELIETFEAHGFAQTGPRGKYAIMEISNE
jgi:GNAT superfamily N-acetyltransferase